MVEQDFFCQIQVLKIVLAIPVGLWRLVLVFYHTHFQLPTLTEFKSDILRQIIRP